jgi:hypothetical protein
MQSLSIDENGYFTLHVNLGELDSAMEFHQKMTQLYEYLNDNTGLDEIGLKRCQELIAELIRGSVVDFELVKSYLLGHPDYSKLMLQKDPNLATHTTD